MALAIPKATPTTVADINNTPAGLDRSADDIIADINTQLATATAIVGWWLPLASADPTPFSQVTPTSTPTTQRTVVVTAEFADGAINGPDAEVVVATEPTNPNLTITGATAILSGGAAWPARLLVVGATLRIPTGQARVVDRVSAVEVTLDATLPTDIAVTWDLVFLPGEFVPNGNATPWGAADAADARDATLGLFSGDWEVRATANANAYNFYDTKAPPVPDAEG